MASNSIRNARLAVLRWQRSPRAFGFGGIWRDPTSVREDKEGRSATTKRSLVPSIRPLAPRIGRSPHLRPDFHLTAIPQPTTNVLADRDGKPDSAANWWTRWLVTPSSSRHRGGAASRTAARRCVQVSNCLLPRVPPGRGGLHAVVGPEVPGLNRNGPERHAGSSGNRAVEGVFIQGARGLPSRRRDGLLGLAAFVARRGTRAEVLSNAITSIREATASVADVG